uniref:Pyrin domain-containing protein n=1 Tax=Cyprinus carpio TaxID=7962 RepID=A0A8C2J4S3_CYPCA
MMASVSEQLLAALDELDADKLKRFKWHLKNHYGVSAADLEKADALDTVDLMMKRFGQEEAVKITLTAFRCLVPYILTRDSIHNALSCMMNQ